MAARAHPAGSILPSEEPFPEDEYLAAFDDVRQAVAGGWIESGQAHFQRYGAAELAAGTRSGFAWPRQVDFTRPDPADYDEALYLATNPDLAQALARGLLPSPRAHWLRHGWHEEMAGGRPSITHDRWHEGERTWTARPLGPAELGGFDARSYCVLNPDVDRATGGEPGRSLEHWLRFGRTEGRLAPGVAPHVGRSANAEQVLARPFGLDVYAPFAATSGLGTAARNLLRAVQASGVPFEARCFDVTPGPGRVMRDEALRPGRHRVSLVLANADHVEHLIAQYPPGHFDGGYTIAMWAWELPSLRPDWFTTFGAVDEIWTNSAFEHDAIAAFSPVPVQVIRLPVLVRPVSRPASRAFFGLDADAFVFLVTFDVGSTLARKNPFAAIEAHRDAFGDDPSSVLVVKMHSSQHDPRSVRDLNAAIRGMGNVLVVADRLPALHMAMLQSACDCLVSPHRSEGYGLNIAEFLALGKPVVATDWSGSREFLDESVGFPVRCGLREIAQTTGPYRAGGIWAEPSHDSLVEQMRRVRSDPQEVRRRAMAAMLRMRREFSPQAVGAAMLARLRALGLDARGDAAG